MKQRKRTTHGKIPHNLSANVWTNLPNAKIY